MNGNENNFCEIHPLLEKMRESPKAISQETDYIKGVDGKRIFYRKFLPNDEIKKIILIAHGMSGHGEYFVLLADRLVEEGFVIIVPDYRNHGHSEGKKGDLKKFKYILDDYHLFFEKIYEDYPGKPIYLCGGSMGGAVSINFAKYYPDDFNTLAGMILLAPAVKTNFPKPFWIGIVVLLPLIALILLIIPSVRLINMRGNESDGSRNLIQQKYSAQDPVHVQKASLRYLIQVFKHVRKGIKIAPKIEIPVLIFQGTEDKVISQEGVKSFFSKLRSKEKRLVLIEGGYHSLLSDPGFSDKWDLLKDWLKKH